MERSFILNALGNGIRLDERSLTAFRDINFEFHPTQRGHVTINLGRTLILSSVTATVSRPFPDRPSEGLISFFPDLTSLALPEDHPLAESTTLNLVERICKRCVDTESLCIIPGEQVWTIRVDIKVLDYDGGIVDAAVIAAIASLTDFRRPEVTVTEDGVAIIHSSFEKNPVPLTLHNPAIPITFCLLDPESQTSDHATKQQSKTLALADPTLLEESMNGGLLTMAVNRNGEMATLVKSGGEAIDVHSIQTDCYYVARTRSISILDSINVAILKARVGNK